MSFDRLLDPIDVSNVSALHPSDIQVGRHDLPIAAAPTAPVDFGYRSSAFSGGDALVSPAPKPGAVFPERISLNLMPLWSAVSEMPRGLEVLAAPLKFTGIGEVLKTVGESGPGQVLQNLVLEPFRAMGRLAERAVNGELDPKGKSIFGSADPWAQLVENAKLNSGIIADVAEAMSVIPAFKILKGTSFAQGSLFPFLKGVGGNLTAEGAGRILKGDIVGWVTQPIKNPVHAKETAKNWGTVAGRVGQLGMLAGFGTEKVIEGIAPDSWAAREIAGNRFVSEDNSWRFPLDIAESLPLDIFGLVQNGAKALKLGQKASRVLGEEDSVIVDLFDKKLVQRLITSVPSLKPVLEWIDNKSARDAAMWSLLDRTNVSFIETWNAMKAGLKAEVKPDFLPDDVWAKLTKKASDIADRPLQLMHPNQLGFVDQEAYELAIQRELDNMLSRGRRYLREKQFDVIMGNGKFGDPAYRPGWPKFKDIQDPAARLIIAEDFHKKAKTIQDALGDRIEPIVETNLGNQIEAAWGFLDNMTDEQFKAGGKELFSTKYGAISGMLRREDFAKMSRDQMMSYMQKAHIEVYSLRSEPLLEMGRIESELFTVIQEIVKEGATAARLTKRGNLLKELRKVQGGLLKEHEDAIHGLMIAKAARSRELLNTRLGPDELAIVNAEIARMDEQLGILMKDYYEMGLIGSRYTIGKPPVGVVQKVFGPGDLRPEDYLKGRTRLGEIVDALFGAMPNKRLGLQAFKDVDAAFAKAGFDTKVTEGIYHALREEVDLWRKKNIFGTSFNWAPFVSVYSLPTTIINRVVSKTLKAQKLEPTVPEGYKDFAHIFYKAHPGPFKIFARQVLGKPGDTIGYSPTFVNLTRTIYPLVRFSLSPRFIVMNLLEAEFFQTFLGGKKSLGSLTSERMKAVAAQVTNARLDPESGRWVFSIDHSGDEMLQAERDLETLIRLANTWRADQVTEALTRTLENAPAMKDFLKDQGIKTHAQLVDKLDEVWKGRMGVISGEIAEGATEQALRKKITDVRYRLNHPLSKADAIKVRSELNHLEAQYDDVVVKRQVRAAAEAAKIESKYALLLDAVVEAEKKSIEKARRVLFANPDRSVAERLFNSYLLYWPLSYQIKAGKALLEFMFSRGFGHKTNLAPAVAISHAGKWLEEKKETDPEVNAFFKNHSQAFFLAQQLFPALPDETGVSLSPVFRLPVQVARGYKTAEDAINQGLRVGLPYDLNLVQEFMKQESRPGGLFAEIFKKGDDE